MFAGSAAVKDHGLCALTDLQCGPLIKPLGVEEALTPLHVKDVAACLFCDL